MQQHLLFETRLDLESSNSEKLLKLVHKSASSKNLIVASWLDDNALIWQSDYFGLDHVRLFQNLDQQQQFRILRALNQNVLKEIYFIEL